MAISQLSQLKSFRLDLSSYSLIEFGDEDSPRYLNDFGPQGRENLWDPCLDKILPQLKNLENLKLSFGLWLMISPKDRRWISRTFKVLPSLKNLKEFHFMVPFVHLSKSEVSNINSALERMEGLHVLELFNWSGLPIDNSFLDIVDKVKALQLRRPYYRNLSF